MTSTVKPIYTGYPNILARLRTFRRELESAPSNTEALKSTSCFFSAALSTGRTLLFYRGLRGSMLPVSKEAGENFILEGPLGVSFRYNSPVYVPDIRSPGQCNVLDSRGEVEEVTVERESIDSSALELQIGKYGAQYHDRRMDLVLGSFGEGLAYSSDSFSLGGSICSEKEVREFLTIVALVGDNVSESLKHYSVILEREREREELIRVLKGTCNIASVAQHALAGPLTSAILKLENAKSKWGDDPELPQELDWVIARIKGGIELNRAYLKSLVDGNFQFVPHIALVDVNALIQSIECPGVEINLTEGLPNIETDRSWLETILNELIHNAEKNRLPDRPNFPTIISTHPMERGIEIWVNDQGRGLTAEEQKNIFEGGDPSKSETGFGNGLQKMKQMVRSLKGNIWAESEGPGKGSTFKIFIPNY